MALKGVALWVLGLALLAQLDGGAAGEETTTTHPDSTTTFVDELVPEGPTEAPKKSVKNFTCQVTGALLSMANSIKVRSSFTIRAREETGLRTGPCLSKDGRRVAIRKG